MPPPYGISREPSGKEFQARIAAVKAAAVIAAARPLNWKELAIEMEKWLLRSVQENS